MQVWNVLHAARCQYRTQKSRQKSPSRHHRTTLSGYIFANKARIDNRKKNLLSCNISSTCPHNMVNFGPLAAEIVSLVWGTPANFNGFGVLAALLDGTLVVGVSQTLRRWTDGAGRPSRWALAHILVHNTLWQLITQNRWQLLNSTIKRTIKRFYYFTVYWPTVRITEQYKFCYVIYS